MKLFMVILYRAFKSFCIGLSGASLMLMSLFNMSETASGFTQVVFFIGGMFSLIYAMESLLNQNKDE